MEHDTSQLHSVESENFVIQIKLTFMGKAPHNLICNFNLREYNMYEMITNEMNLFV